MTDTATSTIEVVDSALTLALGDEMRRARERLDLDQADVARRMPDQPHAKTYASYEQGRRQCNVVRLYWIAAALETTAAELLLRAEMHLDVELAATGTIVDLQTLAADSEPGPLRRWARDRLESYPGATLARLDSVSLREMAVIFHMSITDLHRQLARFTPPPT